MERQLASDGQASRKESAANTLRKCQPNGTHQSDGENVTSRFEYTCVDWVDDENMCSQGMVRAPGGGDGQISVHVKTGKQIICTHKARQTRNFDLMFECN